jgi:gliding motility-associated-like protein
VVVHFDTAGTSVVQLIINNKGCISTLIAAPITVRPLPKVSYVNRQDVCEGELVTVALNGIEPDITGYNWNFGSDAAVIEYGVVTTGGPFGIRYPGQGQYMISVTATKNGCTSKPAYQTIYVHPNPNARISYPSTVDLSKFCASDTLSLSVQRVADGGVYKWSPAAYFQGFRDTLNNQVDAVISQSSVIRVNVRTAFGCEANDSLRVTTQPCCGVYFANAFAPNGQIEKNRTFKPITQGVHKINTFRVMNRWGQVVYETKIERAGWDGRFNGVPQDMGTYYYYINYKCDGKDVEDRGEFLLMR